MKIIYFATSKSAVPVLESLFSSEHDVVCVVTACDVKAGRGLHLTSSEVKQCALNHQACLFQPENINSQESIQFLRNQDADIFITYAYGQILKPEVLYIPLHGSINIHASLLPKYRGAAPVNWAIYHGEKVTGITIIQMNEYLDRGDIILQREMAISQADNAISIDEKISRSAAHILFPCLKRIESGNIELKTQHDEEATFAPKLKKQDGLIDWNRSADEIKNQIRAFVPWPGSFTFLNDNLIKIHEAEIARNEPSAQPGEIVAIDQQGIFVQAKKDQLVLKALQPEAKRIMSAQDFINGHKINQGDKFTNSN